MLKKLKYSILINAKPQKVWFNMISFATYIKWTSAFSEGSYFEGSWDKGSEIKFLGPDGGGMISKIAENIPYKFISIQHLGFISEGKVDMENEQIQSWGDQAFENYTFNGLGDQTELLIEISVPEEYESMFNETWPKALEILKSLSETTKNITVEVEIQAPLETVWTKFTDPAHIVNWYFASDDWHAPKAENDLRNGGKFKTKMASKDGSAEFDFEGFYTEVREKSLIKYEILDTRKVEISFIDNNSSIKVIETFEMENGHTEDLQRAGWQAILNNFKAYAEQK